jgi:hypothetical protein
MRNQGRKKGRGGRKGGERAEGRRGREKERVEEGKKEEPVMETSKSENPEVDIQGGQEDEVQSDISAHRMKVLFSL